MGKWIEFSVDTQVYHDKVQVKFDLITIYEYLAELWPRLCEWKYSHHSGDSFWKR